MLITTSDLPKTKESGPVHLDSDGMTCHIFRVTSHTTGTETDKMQEVSPEKGRDIIPINSQ